MDAFALFEEKRMPYLDQEKLKEKFLAFTEKKHPDKFRHLAEHREVEEKFSQQHEAYRILSNLKLRLAHLLQLEFNIRTDEVKKMPETTMTLAWKLGEICQKVDLLKSKESSSLSALGKALILKEKMDLISEVRQNKSQLEAELIKLEDQVKLLNPAWEKGIKEKEVLLHLYQASAFLTRWSHQLDERLVWLIH